MHIFGCMEEGIDHAVTLFLVFVMLCCSLLLITSPFLSLLDTPTAARLGTSTSNHDYEEVELVRTAGTAIICTGPYTCPLVPHMQQYIIMGRPQV